jgi:hypothetical protein
MDLAVASEAQMKKYTLIALCSLAVGAAVATACMWRYTQSAVRAALREATDLAGAGALVARPSSPKEIIAETISLVPQIAKVKTVAPSATPQLHVQAETEPLQVPDCGEFSVRCNVLSLGTDAGNVAIVGEGELLRDGKVIASAPFVVEKSIAHVVDPTKVPKPRWGAGPVVLLTRDGLSYGAIVSAPPVHVGPLELSVIGGVAVGATSTALAGALVRW